MRTTTRRQLLAAVAVVVSLVVLAAGTWAQAVGEAGALMPKKPPAGGLGSAISGAAQQAGTALGGQTGQTPTPSQPLAPTPGMEQTTLDQAVTEGAVPLRVMVGKSILVNTTDRLIRVSVTDPAIADALVVTPTQLLIHGRAPGEVSLVLWDALERSRSFDLRVDVDATAAAEEIRRIFPGETILVSSSRSAIVLSGHVTTEDVARNAGSVAGAYARAVVNVLTFGPLGAQEILLEVKFAELNRTALKQFGVNLLSTNGKLLAETGTGQRPPFEINDTDTFGVPTSTVTTDRQFAPLNVFLFRPDVHVGIAIQALQQKNLAQILAEPNLIALNGKEASFLAGGEFPIPIVQGGGNVGNVTIQFKEFGVRLKFTPVIQPNGNIRLRVMPEVSALDFANGVTISGFTIPGLVTRRAETELELQDGQSFVIAGLIDNRVSDVASKIPWLGDIPILGNLFRSSDRQRRNSELLVLVTARRISPADQRPDLPKFPQQWLDPNKFDQGTKPESGMKPSGGGK
ncbi:MAG: type II and III secretion system protein family protein [Acidobacteria bacterium]|nr:type II and III secretion system protein family protein [Acidobacteriota bacterium]